MTAAIDGDDATTASLDPAEHDAIDISKVPALVFWVGEDGQNRSLSHSESDHVTLDIKFDAKAQTAFFKITANLAFKNTRHKSNIFLFIHPERIQSLTVVDDEDDGHLSAPNRLGAESYSLRFTLTIPPALIVPKHELAPKDDKARSRLESLQALAATTSFHVNFPCDILLKDCLVALCGQASSSGYLKTMPNSENLAKLYGGMGARVIDHEEAGSSEVLPTEMSNAAARAATRGSPDEDREGSEVDPHGTFESPPSYDKLGHSPPYHSPAARKRRRLASEATADDSSQVRTLLEICRQGFGDVGCRLDRIEHRLDDLGSRLDRVERRIRAGNGQEDLPSGQQSDQQDVPQRDVLGQRIDCVEERVASVEVKLDTGLSELADTIEYQMADAKEELERHVTICVEDEMGTAQSQFEDFVRDEIRNVGEEVEDTVREKLIDALTG
ncbi:hypothetical protein VPNG_05459 [Cytospora leucostoma]|uniref:Uncharacterized protein n=1 Tax=Cytospora leucostoma TaxID=1230097 RepID=A0A423XBQ2_9PEZI|nr:hypothetical protein VPNG_05459 [Cytospora leucostoma]